MSMVSYDKITERVKSGLTPKRFTHTMGVAEEAIKLALHYGDEVLAEKAKIAGMLHDIVKELPKNKRDEYCKEFNICQEEIFKETPELIHPFLGAEVAKSELGIDDDEILNAVRYHTSGHANMTTLEKIVYIADYIEPNRAEFIGLSEGRRLAYIDLDLTMEFMLTTILEYIGKQGKTSHNLSLEALEYFKELNKSNGKSL